MIGRTICLQCVYENIKTAIQESVDGDKIGVAVISLAIDDRVKTSEILPGREPAVFAYRSINNSNPKTNEGKEYPRILKTRANWSINLL